MKDFTIKKYKELLSALIAQKYSFQTFDEFLDNPKNKSIILRQDVDLLPENSLVFAKILFEKGVKGVFYFRVVPCSWNVDIIKEISSMGHEIGYHYECLTTSDGDFHKAIKDFTNNLEKFRKIVPVTTICMHGSPRSGYDSKDLWKKYDYRQFGIKGEPYFDINFNRVLYLTDTGRKWNGENVSVRDKVQTSFSHSFNNTNQIIQAAVKGQLPDNIMFTFHPQRWSDNLFFWSKELFFQNIKNQVKKYFFVEN